MENEASRHQATISTEILTRLVILLIAAWDAIAGLVLLAFRGASAGALGAGVEDRAGQRLLGAHLLVLVPVYLILAWKPRRFVQLLWLPFAAQGAVVLVIGYNMLEGDTEFGDGILAFAVGLIFVVLLAFLWVSEQRTIARLKSEAEIEATGRPAPALPPGAQPAQGPDGGSRQ
ncbi:MAG TPA: hypothetical protein VNN10_12895 [Dehalococcoidia bacterium]|nr:hypothetical protein [Dehalococcoidia bacterium]